MNPAGDGAGLAGDRFDLAALIGLRQAARRLRLATRVTAVSWRAGMHASRMRGRGMSFAESRPYQAGDDVRWIDWRVTARSGRAHTKVFEEEKERAVLVVASFGPSMYFGTRLAFKHVVAAEVAALLGWAALAAGDRIGLLLGCAGGHVERRPRAGRRALMGMLGALATRSGQAAGESPPLSDTLRRATEVARPGSLVCLVGDFYDLDEAARRHLLRLARHNDVLVAQVLDAVELAPPPPGRYPVSDGRRIAELAVRREDAGAWQRLEQRLRQPLRELAQRHRLLHGVVSAGRPVVEQLDAIVRGDRPALGEEKPGRARPAA